MVGVSVGADDQPDVAELPAHLRECELELPSTVLARVAGVDEDDAVAGRDRVGVAVRRVLPRQREPQPPDAGKDALAAAQLVPSAAPRLSV